MADVSTVARIVSGIARNIDVSASGNAMVINVVKVGTVGSNTQLTKAILDNLVALQNGSDFANGTNSHTHDGRYYTESELTSRTSASGATLVAVERKTYSNITGYTTLIGDTLANYNIQALIDAINTSLSSSGNEKPDDVFRVVGSGDATKKMAFEVDGITTGTTRTVTMPDANVNLADANNAILKDGSRAFTADQPMGGFKITGLGTPTASTDAATKGYVDSVAQGLKPKEAVRVATTANITLSGPQTIDGVSAIAGNRVLVKNQSSASANGIYVVAAGAWTRSTDFDSLTPIDEVNGSIVAVQEGTANAGKVFVQTGVVNTLGSDPINFVMFNSVDTLVGGDGITVSGTNISVDHDGEGLTFSGAQLALELDGSTLSKSASGVKVADNGITATQLATDAVTTAKIQNAAVDDTKLATNSVTSGKIAANAVTAAKLNSDVVGAGNVLNASNAIQTTGAFLTFTNNSGVTILAGDTVRMTTTTNEVAKAQADSLANCQGVIGVALANITNGSSGLIQIAGRATLTGGGAFTIGSRVYLSSATAGQGTSTAPTASGTCVHLLGIAVSATEVVMNLQLVAEIE